MKWLPLRGPVSIVTHANSITGSRYQPLDPVPPPPPATGAQICRSGTSSCSWSRVPDPPLPGLPSSPEAIARKWREHLPGECWFRFQTGGFNVPQDWLPRVRVWVCVCGNCVGGSTFDLGFWIYIIGLGAGVGRYRIVFEVQIDPLFFPSKAGLVSLFEPPAELLQIQVQGQSRPGFKLEVPLSQF